MMENKEQMKGSEEFFVLVAEYRMMINRIKVAMNQGMKKDHPDMQKMIQCEKALCEVVDQKIVQFMPKLNERFPDAAEQVYKKFNIQMV